VADMQEFREQEPPRPLLVSVLEAAAAAAGWDRGHHIVTLEFDDGRLRRWGHDDPRNSPRELACFDVPLVVELDRLAARRLRLSNPHG
jgi:hypothetical protein